MAASDSEFSLKYPPNWRREGEDATDSHLDTWSFDLMNDVYFGAREPREFVPPAVAAAVNVSVRPPREDDRYTVDSITRECESGQGRADPQGVATTTQVDGGPAVRCTGFQSLPQGVTLHFDSLWIKLASGRTLVVTALRWDVSQREEAIVGAILDSIGVSSS